MRRKPPSLLLVMGVYAGIISALITLPVTLPLLIRLVNADVSAIEGDNYARTGQLGRALVEGRKPNRVPPFARATDLRGNEVYAVGGPLPVGIERRACDSPNPSTPLSIKHTPYLASCWKGRGLRVVAIWERHARSYHTVGLLVVILATVSGLVNALGITQLMRPLSQISKALDQVGAGRPTSMKLVGLGEIDDLILRLNRTAAAVESRENEILGRIRVIQELARLVAHEVRNPLQSLTLLTQLIADSDQRAERIDLAESIQREIAVLDDVVRRLLTEGASHGALRLNMEQVDVPEMLGGVRRLRSEEASSRAVTLSLNAPEGLTAELDRMLVVRAVQNLIGNALRAVPAKTGVVEVTARIEDELLIIAVDDNGHGVDPAVGDRVFEMNVTGGNGTGLGLFLTRGVAEAHGGTATFENSHLGGARFELRLPSRQKPDPDGGEGSVRRLS